MKISTPNCHQQQLRQIFLIDCEKLHKAKVEMGAIPKETSIEDSLYSDLGELDMIINSTIKDYFADYGKDIIIEDE
jgi:hypothetical protein